MHSDLRDRQQQSGNDFLQQPPRVARKHNLTLFVESPVNRSLPIRLVHGCLPNVSDPDHAKRERAWNGLAL